MNSVIYKVIFSAYEQFENKNLTLSFQNLEFEKIISLPEKFILDLKKKSENVNNIITFQNIEEILIIGNPSFDYSINYYHVILCTFKLDGKKTGYLIGNVKNKGDILIGIWPFNLHIKKLTRDNLLNAFDEVIKNSDKFTNICLISQ